MSATVARSLLRACRAARLASQCRRALSSQVQPRSVALADVSEQLRTGPAAYILNAVASHDAAHYVVARDDAGVPMALSETLQGRHQLPKSLTFLPLGTGDALAQRSFWLSSAFMLGAALQHALPAGVLLGSVPAIHYAPHSRIDAASGYAYDFVQAAPTAPVPYSADYRDARHHVDAALGALAVSQAGKAPLKLSDASIAAIEREMKLLAKASHTFVLDTLSWQDAWSLFAQNPLKLHAMLKMKEGTLLETQRVRVVRISGTSFVDLLSDGADAAPLRSTKHIRATEVRGWSAVSLSSVMPESLFPRNAPQSATRVRAISFASQAELQEYLKDVSEAEKSDHRTIGQAQSLFFVHDTSPGSPFVLPHGMRLMRKVERVIRQLYDAFAYEEVQTPQIFRSGLWKQSGHWDKYRDDMFSAQGFEAGESHASCCGSHAEHDAHIYGVKPMNCPGHCVMFANEPRSYRDLPLRVAEFSPLHRYVVRRKTY